MNRAFRELIFLVMFLTFLLALLIMLQSIDIPDETSFIDDDKSSAEIDSQAITMEESPSEPFVVDSGPFAEMHILLAPLVDNTITTDTLSMQSASGELIRYHTHESNEFGEQTLAPAERWAQVSEYYLGVPNFIIAQKDKILRIDDSGQIVLSDQGVFYE